MHQVDIEKNLLNLIYQVQQQQSPKKAQREAAFKVYQMDRTFIDIQRSFQYVGDNSRYQQRVTLILSLQFCLFSFTVMCMSFFFKKPHFKCDFANNGFFQDCSQKQYCKLKNINNQLIYQDTGKHISIAQHFNLYCQQGTYGWIAQCCFFAGGFLSGFIQPFINQCIGRKPTLLLLIMCTGLCLIFCGIATSINNFIIWYFVLGIFIFAYQTSVHIYISQISGARFRNISINVLAMVWAGSPILFSLTTLFFTDYWNCFIFIIGLPFLLSAILVYNFFLQSPRYLLSKSRYAEVRQIFRTISIINRRQPYDFRLQQEIDEINRRYSTFSKRESQIMIKQLPQLRIQVGIFPTLITIIICWSVRYLIYYGISIALQTITSNYFTNLALTSISQLAAALMITPFKLRFSNLSIIITSLAVLSLASAIIQFTRISDQCSIDSGCYAEIVSLFMTMIQRFAITCFGSALITYAGGVFPMRIRSLAYGVSMNLGRIVMPFIPLIIDTIKQKAPNHNPMGTLGLISIFNFVAVYYCLQNIQ